MGGQGRCEPFGWRARMIVRLCLVLAAVLAGSTVEAEPMRFELGGADGRLPRSAFIQASGEITLETPKEFERFLASLSTAPNLVRLHSPGGNLTGGIALGELFRARGFSTEVGSDRFAPDYRGILGGRASERVPGMCASACAYAFLGGTERFLDPDARLGFHRFYQENALANPTTKMFTGEDIDKAQTTTAYLVLYAVKMGVDARVAVTASQAGPNEMRWISVDEAGSLRITYDPTAWKPWRIETYSRGVVAVSETEDQSKRMVAACSKRLGPHVILTDKGQDETWFKQNRTCATEGRHPVFGTDVDPNQVQVMRGRD